jgi:thioredoxin reductase (NADPH)
MLSEIKNIQEFQNLTQTKTGLYVLMFTGNTCGYCKMMKPLFEELSQDVELKDFTFALIDRDENRDLITKYNFEIPTIPRFFAIKFTGNGEFTEDNILIKIGGSQSKSEFKDKLLTIIKKNLSDAKIETDKKKTAKEDKKPKIAIIGSGPSGLTSAIYTSRAGINTTVYTGLQPGGQLTTTTEIENFPGIFNPETKTGMMGPDLMQLMQKQAENFGAKMIMDEVKKLELEGEKFKLSLSGNRSGIFDAVIIATGASAKYLGIKDEEKYIGKGYHTCATCDGFFYKDKEIVVVGGGDTAMEEANFLSKFAYKVYILNRTESFKASKFMLEKIKKNPKIEILTNKSILKFIGDDEVQSIIVIDNISQKEEEMHVDGVFVAIGHNPNSTFVGDILDKDSIGYLISQQNLSPELRTSKYSTATKIPGIFVSGDIADHTYRQAITAAGEGCKAAMDLEKWLEAKH